MEDNAVILETVSENNGGRRSRGRPRRFSDHDILLAQFVCEKKVTPRTLNNTCHSQRAVAIILAHVEELPELRYLVDRYPKTVLSILGRLRFPEAILAAALDYCREKPVNLKQARASMSSKDKPKRFDSRELCAKVVSVVNDYIATCNEEPRRDGIEKALRRALNGGLNEARQWYAKE